jgi:hypothetical protein
VRSRSSTLVLIVALVFSLTSCGVIGFVDSKCVDIKKQSELKREIGTTFLDMAQSGSVGEGLTLGQVEADGFKYIIEGTELVLENPQCFSEEEVETAKRLLGR